MRKIKFKTDDVYYISIIRKNSTPHEKVELLIKNGKLISAFYYEDGVQFVLGTSFPIKTDFFKMPKKSEIVFEKGTKTFFSIGREDFKEHFNLHIENNEVVKCWREMEGYSISVIEEIDCAWLSLIF